ncbi:MAG: hypothetical protein CYPHOPRED_003272 [Cyphobasidiales sp. Tagirdzhanova-0007]|nr:MAG: hypothetical protein CYPHOPRED_003272 [Cyphobasidiales sp. Tagirdzhanova-0007]
MAPTWFSYRLILLLSFLHLAIKSRPTTPELAPRCIYLSRRQNSGSGTVNDDHPEYRIISWSVEPMYVLPARVAAHTFVARETCLSVSTGYSTCHTSTPKSTSTSTIAKATSTTTSKSTSEIGKSATPKSTTSSTTSITKSVATTLKTTTVSTTSSSKSTTKTILTTSKPTSVSTSVQPRTTSSTTTCAPSYTGGASTISATGTLPKPTAFVARSGMQLELSGQAYRPVGPNIYWLGLDQNVGPIQYPSKARVREAMAIAVAMGANTIRSSSLGISLGNALSIEPTLGNFNDEAFDIIDYTLFAAREYGLRVIIPLMDEYDYYTGGKFTFLQWLNVSQSNDGAQFYTNQTVLQKFSDYIYQIISHYNNYSQTYNYNDPTIMAWETGNEYGAYLGKFGYPPLSFTNQIAGFIKSVDGNHLVIDGTDGFYNYTTKAIAPGVNSSNIDIMSDHLYPPNNPLMMKEESIVTQYDKAFIIGEYDWTGLNGGTNLSDFITAIEDTKYLGDLLWSVFGHDDQFVTHDDGFSLYYPNGNTVSLQARILQIVQHWYRMTGRAAPDSLVAVACPQAVF